MSGFVYAIECGDVVKIGYATDPVRRLGQLNVGSAKQHRLLGCARGNLSHEKEIHILLGYWRIRGEWFAKAGLVLDFLALLPKPSQVGPTIKSLGGASALARRLTEAGWTISSQAVSQWKRIPADRVHDVSQVTGIPVHQLRPDLWPDDAA